MELKMVDVEKALVDIRQELKEAHAELNGIEERYDWRSLLWEQGVREACLMLSAKDYARGDAEARIERCNKVERYLLEQKRALEHAAAKADASERLKGLQEKRAALLAKIKDASEFERAFLYTQLVNVDNEIKGVR